MIAIDESRTAKGYTPAANVPAAFNAPRTLDGIVIHHWGERGQTHDGVVDFFCTTGPGETSAHFVVSAGRITCIVSPLDAAWHCPGKNASTIGIECRPEATDADYAAVAELIAYLRNIYGAPLPLSMHRDWYSTACPGVWDLARLDRLATVTLTAQSTTTSGVFETMTRAEELEVLTAARKVNRYMDAPIGAVPAKVADAILDESIIRGGGVPGKTTLRSTLAWLDKNLNTIRDAIGAGK